MFKGQWRKIPIKTEAKDTDDRFCGIITSSGWKTAVCDLGLRNLKDFGHSWRFWSFFFYLRHGFDHLLIISHHLFHCSHWSESSWKKSPMFLIEVVARWQFKQKEMIDFLFIGIFLMSPAAAALADTQLTFGNIRWEETTWLKHASGRRALTL